MLDRRRLIAASLAALAGPAAAQAGAYAATLAHAYGAPIDPLAAHRQALAAARRAQARADLLLKGQGLSRGSVAERLGALARDDRWLYADDDAGRDRAVADMNARLDALKPRLPAAFGDLLIADARVRRMSAADEASGKGGYREPGSYYVDLKAIRARPAWTLPSVAFHEVIPGHLLQMPLQAAAPADRPRAAAAFFEAWAIYAEQLACDLGAYAADPRGEIGYLQWRLFRLARIVADTGLHALGWSRDRALAEMTALQGRSIAFITMEADVDRIIATPARWAAEGLGALEIARLRPRDRRAWPAFHGRLLTTAPWPPGQLAKVVA